MRIHISFVEAEREQVRALVTAAKLLLKGSRYHEAKQAKDGVYNAYLSTSKH